MREGWMRERRWMLPVVVARRAEGVIVGGVVVVSFCGRAEGRGSGRILLTTGLR